MNHLSKFLVTLFWQISWKCILFLHRKFSNSSCNWIQWPIPFHYITLKYNTTTSNVIKRLKSWRLNFKWASLSSLSAIRLNRNRHNQSSLLDRTPLIKVLFEYRWFLPVISWKLSHLYLVTFYRIKSNSTNFYNLVPV